MPIPVINPCKCGGCCQKIVPLLKGCYESSILFWIVKGGKKSTNPVQTAKETRKMAEDNPEHLVHEGGKLGLTVLFFGHNPLSQIRNALRLTDCCVKFTKAQPTVIKMAIAKALTLGVVTAPIGAAIMASGPASTAVVKGAATVADPVTGKATEVVEKQNFESWTAKALGLVLLPLKALKKNTKKGGGKKGKKN